MAKKENGGWNPYIAGSLTGVLAVLSVWIAGKYIGASTSFARGAHGILSVFSSEHTSTLEYFEKYFFKPADWQLYFLVGILIGALVASLLTRSFKWQAVPDMWRERFGPSIAKRAWLGILGGAIAVFGARMAGGCPSGHGLSGLMQLSVSGFIALVMFFCGGIIMARLLYGGAKEKPAPQAGGSKEGGDR